MPKPTIASDTSGIWISDTEGAGMEIRLSLKWKEQASQQQRKKSKAARPRKVLARSRPFDEVRGGKLLIPGVTEEHADIVLEELDKAAFAIRARVYRAGRQPVERSQAQPVEKAPTRPVVTRGPEPQEDHVSKPEMSLEEATERVSAAPKKVPPPPPEVRPTFEDEKPLTPEQAEALAEKFQAAPKPTGPQLSDQDRAAMAGIKIVAREP